MAPTKKTGATKKNKTSTKEDVKQEPEKTVDENTTKMDVEPSETPDVTDRSVVSETSTKSDKKPRKKSKKQSESEEVSTDRSEAPIKTIKKKKKKDEMSKRTPSSYVLFSMEERKKISATSPDLGLGEVLKQCGQAWKAMSDEDKKPWVEKAAILKEEKLKNMPVVEKSLRESRLII